MLTTKTIHCVSPLIPFDVLHTACDKVADQGWEVISFCLAGAAQSRIATTTPPMPMYQILCRRNIDASIIDIPYPKISI
jgi:hypothetical protein